MSNKSTRLFSDVTTVSRGARIKLKKAGLINDDDTVVSWSRVNPVIRDRMMTETETKQLIILELTRTDETAPREDLLARLVNYLTTLDRVEVRRKLASELLKLNKEKK